jgi:hypothetical protein
MPGTPFGASLEGCGQDAQRYSPDNALRVIEWYEGMSSLIDAVSRMLTQQGEKTTEEFYLYPGAAQFARELGRAFLRYKDPCDAAKAAFVRAHEKDLQRVLQPQRNQYKWDITQNQE